MARLATLGKIAEENLWFDFCRIVNLRGWDIFPVVLQNKTLKKRRQTK